MYDTSGNVLIFGRMLLKIRVTGFVAYSFQKNGHHALTMTAITILKKRCLSQFKIIKISPEGKKIKVKL